MVIQVMMAFVGSLGFAVIFRTKRERLLFTALGGGITWCLYLFCASRIPSYFACNLIAAIGAAVYGELMALVFKTPPVVFRVAGHGAPDSRREFVLYTECGPDKKSESFY